MFRRAAPLLMLLIAPAAFALNNRSAVSVNGNDLNPCTVASPCRSFGAAIAQTNPGGEIIALDSAGYGPFTIGMAVTISGVPGVHAAITATSGSAITVNANPEFDYVVLRNLVLIGAGGTIGINDPAARELRVLGCLIRGFTGYGINANLVGGANPPGLSVAQTAILDNSGAVGIYLRCQLGIKGTVTDSLLQGNAVGVHGDSNAQFAIVNTNISGNGTGAEVVSTFGSTFPVRMILENCTIVHNALGLYANASGSGNVATAVMSQLVLAYNTTATDQTSANSSSFNNNRFVANGADGGPFLSVGFQ